MRLGFLGGSFDPLHMGHLQMAHIALEEASLDKVYFLPSSRNWQKSHTPAPGARRVSWIKKCIEGQKKLDVLDMDLREGLVFTVDTVRLLKEKFKGAELLWIIGADQLANLHTWRDAATLVQLVSFFVFERENCPITQPYLPGIRISFARKSALSVSSSQLRELLKRGESILGLVPKPIEEELSEFYRTMV